MNDHLVQEILVLRKIFQQLSFGHPRVVLAPPDVQMRGADHLRLEEEPLLDAYNRIKRPSGDTASKLICRLLDKMQTSLLLINDTRPMCILVLVEEEKMVNQEIP